MNEKIHKAVEILKSGGIILYPTDTVWGIGCDATNSVAIQKIYSLKKREFSKSMIVIVENENRLQSIVEVPQVAWDILDYSTKPTTIIYDDPKNVSQKIIAKDNTLGIRLVKNDICKQLISKLNRPIVSTSANISGENTPLFFKDISNEIVNEVDFILDIQENQINTPTPSAIIKLSQTGIVKIIRK